METAEKVDVGGPAFFKNNVYVYGAINVGFVDLIAQTSAPTAAVGRIYFNSTDQQFYGCKDGTNWSILG